MRRAPAKSANTVRLRAIDGSAQAAAPELAPALLEAAIGLAEILAVAAAAAHHVGDKTAAPANPAE